MDPDVQRLAEILTVIGTFSGAMIGLGLVAHVAFRWTSPKRRRAGAAAAPQIDDARFTRLEQAVDVIAIEVERIAEAQRFTAQLMTARAADREEERRADRIAERGSPGAPRPVITPH